MRSLDVIIVGQGLAGTTLAWRLIEQRLRVMVVDPRNGPSASRVAAGLLAPVGGKRLALAWQAREAWSSAIAFYRQAQTRLGVPLLNEAPPVRLFTDSAQQAEFASRSAGPLLDMIVSRDLGLNPADFDEGLGGFVVRGARLDVSRYLDASRVWFEQASGFRQAEVFPENDFDFADPMVAIPSLGLRAKQVVLCCGNAHANVGNALRLPFEPAKGEVLTIRSPGLAATRVVQRGVWLAPIGQSLFRVGATFDREYSDASPTQAGREALLGKLRVFLKRPFDVVAHNAAVRPIVQGRVPVVGALGPPQLGVFNGLGANGTLWAPRVSGIYADHIVSGRRLPAEIDVQRRFPG